MPRPIKSQPTAATGPRLVKRGAAKLSAAPEVTHEQIAMRAYEIFQQDGFAHGNHVDHWLRAEQELKSVPTVPRPKRVAAARAQG